MIMKRFEINPYDNGPYFEEEFNKKISGSVHVHTMQAPYNEGKPILLYAFFPDAIKEKEKEVLRYCEICGKESHFLIRRASFPDIETCIRCHNDLAATEPIIIIEKF